MKTFNLQYNIGKVKYVINFHDGFSTHPDGSPFFEIRTFTNKKERNKFITKLKKYAYTQTN